jgi:hypothetical protein
MIACGCLGFGNLLPGLGCFRFITIFTTQNFYISLFLSTDHDSPSRRPFSGGPGSDTGRPDRPRLYPARCYSYTFPPVLLDSWCLLDPTLRQIFALRSLWCLLDPPFCPPVPLVSPSIPPRVLPSPWCLVGPTAVFLRFSVARGRCAPLFWCHGALRPLSL